MGKSLGHVLCAALLIFASAVPSPVSAGPSGPGWDKASNRHGEARSDEGQSSVLTIPADAAFPMSKRISLASGKSLMVQFPVALKDVLVADPNKMDAVVQSSDRVFLIAKEPGQTNAFFFDETGEQILTIEVNVGADLKALEVLLRRLIAGSNIKVETAGKAIILTGNVRTPVDATRAADIASQFASAAGGAYAGSDASNASSSTQVPGQPNISSANGGNQGQSANESAKSVINLLTVDAEEQVMLKVTVAEVQRSLLKQLGVNLGAVINAGSFSTTLLTSNALPLTAAAGLGTLPIFGVSTEGDPTDPAVGCPVGSMCAVNGGPSTGTYGNSGTSGGFDVGGNGRINHAIRALERAGLVRTLAEPNLTAISGEPAKFLAGGEYPVPVTDGQGGISVTFKEFGVGVAFTPVVLSEGRISLKIETEVSELTNVGGVTLSGLSIPALSKRQAKSTVELPSGGSLALAGLISEDTRQNIDGLPGVKDLPILGTLFRSRDFIKKETELVVIVTPYLVKPVSRQELSKPTDSISEAGDFEASFLGHLNRIYGQGRPQPVGDLKGDYGFIVE